MNNNFSSRLKLLRKERKETQQALADLLNVRRSTYGEYERGKILPPMDKMKSLADHFGVTVDYLFSGKEKQNESIDIARALIIILNQLKDQNNDLSFDGEPLEQATKQLLIESLNHAFEIALLMKKSKSSEQLEQT